MKCNEAGEWFGIYQDLPEDSPERLAVDLHVSQCSQCAEEFSMWEESALLIHELPQNDEEQAEHITYEWVNQNVMSRIYAEQSWYMPTVRRTYSFSLAFRKRVAGILAALLAIFVCGFLYTVFGRASDSTASTFASSNQFGDSVSIGDIPVASLSDPIMHNLSPAMPEYWVALSMLGMIMTLLILNWLSRVRS
jgi:hypothetical protein